MRVLKKFFSKTNLILYAIIVVLMLVDIASKYIVQTHIALGDSVTFIPGFLDFTYTLNKGAAWSMFAGQDSATLILGITSVVFAIACFAFNYFFNKGKNLLYYFGFCLTLAGTLGNAFDRLFLGAVRDFIKTTFMSFPIFNIADMCLVVGLVLICIWYIIQAFKTDKKSSGGGDEDNAQLEQNEDSGKIIK